MKNYHANRDLLETLEAQKIKIQNLKEEVKILQRKLDQQIAKERMIKQWHLLNGNFQRWNSFWDGCSLYQQQYSLWKERISLLMFLNSFMKFFIYLNKKCSRKSKKAANAWGINDRFVITSNALINFNSTEDGQRIQDL